MGNEVKHIVTQSQAQDAENSVFNLIAGELGGPVSDKFDHYDIRIETAYSGDLEISFVHVVLSEKQEVEQQLDVDRFGSTDKFFFQHEHRGYILSDLTDMPETTLVEVQDAVEAAMSEWEQPYISYGSDYLKSEDEHHYQVILKF